MAPGDPRVEHVTDTALLVAAVRAMETSRPDGLVRDPLAARLAGERGMAFARKMPGMEWMCIGLGLRYRFMDGLLTDALAAHEIATALLLGAGLDTRPWRLPLPPQFRWIEVDFQAILDFKAAALASEKPSCRVERVVADLNDAAQRQAVWSAAAGAPALMITEGLLMYLPPETVGALAAEAAAAGVRYWLLDVSSRQLMSQARGDCQDVESLRPKDHLKGAEILELAKQHGWEKLAQHTYTRDGWNTATERIRSLPRGEAWKDERGTAAGDPSGVYLFGRSDKPGGVSYFK